MEFYQGPVNVENCHFSRYGNYWWADEVEKVFGIRPVRPGAALSFRRNNVYPTKPWCNVMGLKFDSCDGVSTVWGCGELGCGEYECVCVCVCVRARACVRACVRVRA